MFDQFQWIIDLQLNVYNGFFVLCTYCPIKELNDQIERKGILYAAEKSKMHSLAIKTVKYQLFYNIIRFLWSHCTSFSNKKSINMSFQEIKIYNINVISNEDIIILVCTTFFHTYQLSKILQTFYTKPIIRYSKFYLLPRYKIKLIIPIHTNQM